MTSKVMTIFYFFFLSPNILFLHVEGGYPDVYFIIIHNYIYCIIILYTFVYMLYFVIKPDFPQCIERFRPDGDNFQDNPGYTPPKKVPLKNLTSRFRFSRSSFHFVVLESE